MLYKFKSKAAGDVIMLEANGRQILEIIGKDAGPKGIIEPGEMSGAIAALEAAISGDEAQPKSEGITLRQRAVPFIDLLKRSMAESHEVVWGV